MNALHDESNRTLVEILDLVIDEDAIFILEDLIKNHHENLFNHTIFLVRRISSALEGQYYSNQPITYAEQKFRLIRYL